MSYFVFCTFDLKRATSDDYKAAYSDLAKIGLQKVVVSSQNNKVVIPTTAVAGEFTGADVGSVRDAVRKQVKNAFAARRFSSEIFIVAGGDWAWGAEAT